MHYPGNKAYMLGYSAIAMLYAILSAFVVLFLFLFVSPKGV